MDGLVVDCMLLGCCFIASSHAKRTKTYKIIGRHGSNKNLDENIILYGFYDSFTWFVKMFLRHETKKSKEKHLVVKNL